MDSQLIYSGPPTLCQLVEEKVDESLEKDLIGQDISFDKVNMDSFKGDDFYKGSVEEDQETKTSLCNLTPKEGS